MSPEGAADDDCAGKHACPAVGAGAPGNNDEAAPHPVSETAARIAPDHNLPVAHAGPLAGKRAAEPVADVAGNADLAAPHRGGYVRPRAAADDHSPAAHTEAEVGADITLDPDLAARHARTDVIETVAADGDRERVRSAFADLDGKPVAKVHPAVAAQDRQLAERGLGKAFEPFGEDAVEREPRTRSLDEREADHCSNSRR